MAWQAQIWLNVAHRETFPGGACDKPIELPTRKAPPLQGVQLRDNA